MSTGGIVSGKVLNRTRTHVFFVDDDPRICDVASRTLTTAGFRVTCFLRANDCLGEFGAHSCDVLITDVAIPDMDGLELLKEVRKAAPWLPVVLVTGYGDIQTAVKATKAGAVAFLEKPLDKESLLSAVRSALQNVNPGDRLWGRQLTAAEMKVFRLIMGGKTNKEIAKLMSRSVRTIETHRTNIMHKLGAHNSVELGLRAKEMGLA